MLNSYSDSLADILRGSGWTSERRVELGPIEQEIGAHGFILYPILKPIVANFNGLKIKSPNGNWISFDAEWAAQTYDNEDLHLLNSITKGPLCPLGQLSCTGLFGSNNGEIFGLDIDWILIFSAPDIAAFLNGVLLNDKQALQTTWLTAEQKPEYMR